MFKSILATTVLLFSLPIYASAAESPSALQVEPVYSENQVPATKGYFDVDVTAGEQVELQLRLQNNENEPIIVRVNKSNAYTNPSGGILYDTDAESEDIMLLDGAFRMVDHLEVEETVTIPANESYDLPMQITVPETDGQTLLGGIEVTQAAGETEEEAKELGEDEAQFVVDMETTFAVAIKLNLSNQVEPDFSIGNAGFISNTAQVYLELSNWAQLIFGDVEGTYAVMDSSGSELFNGKMDPFIMAPGTKIRYPFAWNHETLEDGDYTLAVSGKAGAQEFTVEEPFAISDEEVQEYAETTNPTAEVDEDGGVPMWVWIAGALAFGLLMFFMGRRKKPAAE